MLGIFYAHKQNANYTKVRILSLHAKTRMITNIQRTISRVLQKR